VIWAESGQIMQVVLNLLSNARDATPPGGVVTITTCDNADWIEITVADTGPGIAEAIRERIFEPFVTTKGAFGGSTVAGTGLGLSVSYGIVREHGGDIEVQSEPGKGTQFMLTFPIGSAPKSVPPAVKREGPSVIAPAVSAPAAAAMSAPMARSGVASSVPSPIVGKSDTFIH